MKRAKELDEATRAAIEVGLRSVLAMIPDPIARTGTLDEIVAAATRAANEIVHGAVSGILKDEREPQKVEVAPMCPNPECGGKKKRRTRPVEDRKKTILTANGAYEIERACFACRYCDAVAIPLDQALGVDDRVRTVEVDQKIAIVGLLAPFEGAARALKELAKIEVSSRTVEEVTEAAGRRAREQAERDVADSRKVALPAAGAALDRFSGALPFLYISPDGTMTPMRPEDRPNQVPTADHPATHREMKVGVVFWADDVMNVSAKRREVRRKRYVATMGSRDQFADEVWATVIQIAGTSRRFQPVVIGDGADWIWEMAAEHYPDAIQILDIFHPLERLWEVANLLYGTKSFEARKWMKEQQARLEASNLEGVLSELKAGRDLKPFKTGDDKALHEKIDEHVKYIEKRRDKMDYGRYLALGLMIGSGVVESSNRRVIGMRLKQAGMHWSLKGADAVARIRALYLSDGDGWDRLWDSKRATA
ncbi:MAG: ISKra4 family transposase [Chloroflexota bacterium]